MAIKRATKVDVLPVSSATATRAIRSAAVSGAGQSSAALPVAEPTSWRPSGGGTEPMSLGSAAAPDPAQVKTVARMAANFQLGNASTSAALDSGGANLPLLLPFAHGAMAGLAPEAINETLAQIDVATVRFGRVPSGALRLEPQMAKGLVQVFTRAIDERIAGVKHDDWRFNLLHATGLAERLRAAKKSGLPDPDLELSAINSLQTSRAEILAFLDPKTGRVHLAEELPLVPEVEAQLDPSAAVTLLHQMMDPSAPVDDAVVREVGQSFPVAALMILKMSNIEISRTEPGEVGKSGRREAKLVGERLIKKKSSNRRTTVGVFNKVFGSLRLAFDPKWDPRFVATTLRHELAHALDSALAAPNLLQLSASPEFLEIYEDTLASMEMGGPLAPPTEYAATNPEEMFAEAAAMYLAEHGSQSQGVLTLHGRGHLKATNPPLYAFMEKLFIELIPAALATPSSHGPEQRLAVAESIVAGLEKIAPPDRSALDWHKIATYKTVLGVHGRSKQMLTEALEAAEQLRSHSRRLFGLITVKDIALQADALSDRIRAHLNEPS